MSLQNIRDHWINRIRALPAGDLGSGKAGFPILRTDNQPLLPACNTCRPLIAAADIVDGVVIASLPVKRPIACEYAYTPWKGLNRINKGEVNCVMRACMINRGCGIGLRSNKGVDGGSLALTTIRDWGQYGHPVQTQKPLIILIPQHKHNIYRGNWLF